MTASARLIKDCNAFVPGEGFRPQTGILIREGVVAGIGKDLKVPRDAEVYDAKGAWTTPGLVDGHTHLGLQDRPFAQSDVNEKSDPVTPYIRVIDAINPFNEEFPPTLLSGVTTVMVVPGSANIFGGLGALIKTYGTVVDRMVLRVPEGMKMALGHNPKNSYGSKGTAPVTRMGNAYLMRKIFVQALEYRSRRKSDKEDRRERDIGLEHVLEVLEGRLSARIHCHRADDIMTALRIAEEFDFNCCFDHATEGYLVADELLARDVPCFIGPNLSPPSKQEVIRKGFGNAVKLRNAGVRFAIVSDHGVDPCWYLSVLAGLAVREGLSEDDGLQAITNWPAEIMGISDRVGVLKEGVDADIVTWDKHPLLMGKPVTVFAAGRPVVEEELWNSSCFYGGSA